MPSLVATCWVGQNSGPIFRRLWTIEHQIKFACARMSVVGNAFFRLTISCYIPKIFAIKSRSCAKSLGRQISGGGGGGGGKGGVTQISDRIL